MPFFDRFWWLRLCAAALIAAALLLEIWFLARSRSGIRPTNAGDTFLLLAVIIGLTIIALILANSARGARDRKRLRLAALDSNQDAVPPSRIVPDPAYAPDVSHTPLIIARPPRRFDSPVLAWLGTWYQVIIVGMSTIIALVLLAGSPLWSLPQGAGVPVTLIQIATFILTILTGALPMSRVTAHSWRRTYGSPRLITADAEGIRWEPTLGPLRFLRWSDARLLEVDFAAYEERPYKSAEVRRRYTLYGRGTVVWWFEPDGAKTHLQGEFAQLLDVIAARTGLRPRTFTAKLSAASDALPIHTSATAKSGDDLPDVTDEQTYAVAYWASTNRVRMVARIIGCLLLAAGFAVVLRALAAIGVIALPEILASLTGWINLATGCILLPAGIVGALLLIGSFMRDTGALVLANALGIRIENVGRPTTLTWADIADIRALGVGDAELYIARGEDESQSIAWPAHLSEREPNTIPPGTIAVTPREMAELVAQRSGHPLLVNTQQRP